MKSNNRERQLRIKYISFAYLLRVAVLKLNYETGITDPLSHPITRTI